MGLAQMGTEFLQLHLDAEERIPAQSAESASGSGWAAAQKAKEPILAQCLQMVAVRWYVGIRLVRVQLVASVLLAF
jgi:hypothetical protein